MDIRQIVMVSGLRDPIVNDLCELFNFEVAFEMIFSVVDITGDVVSTTVMV